MDTKKLLEIAGVEEQAKDAMKKRAAKIAVELQTMHGDMIGSKRRVNWPTSLLDAMVAVEHELDKFINSK